MRSRRGSIDDMALFLVVVFAVGVAFVMLYLGFDTAIDAMILNPQINASSEAVGTLQTTQGILPRLDYLFLMVFIGMAIAIIVISLIVAGNPVFMFLYTLALVVMTAAATILSFAWDTITTKSIFLAIMNDYTITNHIIHYFGYYFAAVGCIAFIAMFIRFQMIQNV